MLGAVDGEASLGGNGLDADFSPDAELGQPSSGSAGGSDATTGNPSDSLDSGTFGFNLTAILDWFNIFSIPLVLWMSVFSLSWWFVSAMTWAVIDQHFFSPPSIFIATVLTARNIVVALLISKWCTHPMKKWFLTEELKSRNLVGEECEISSLEATPNFGQVRFPTDGAPLLLNVRTDGPHLSRGTRVWITHYDAARRVYLVSPTGTQSTHDTKKESSS